MGATVPNLVGLERCTDLREALRGPSVAAQAIHRAPGPIVYKGRTRPSGDIQGNPRANTHHVQDEAGMGLTAYRRETDKTWYCRGEIHSREVHSSKIQASGPNVARFLTNQAKGIVSIDFIVVPPVRFTILCVLVFRPVDRSRMVHFNIAAYPPTAWTVQQVV